MPTFPSSIFFISILSLLVVPKWIVRATHRLHWGEWNSDVFASWHRIVHTKAWLSSATTSWRSGRADWLPRSKVFYFYYSDNIVLYLRILHVILYAKLLLYNNSCLNKNSYSRSSVMYRKQSLPYMSWV